MLQLSTHNAQTHRGKNRVEQTRALITKLLVGGGVKLFLQTASQTHRSLKKSIFGVIILQLCVTSWLIAADIK